MYQKQEYTDWREHALTKELWLEIATLAENAAAKILNRQEVDVDADQRLKGMLYAYSEITTWQPEYAPEAEDTDV